MSDLIKDNKFLLIGIFVVGIIVVLWYYGYIPSIKTVEKVKLESENDKTIKRMVEKINTFFADVK